MQITVNGEPHQLPTPLSLREALDRLGLVLPTHAALALNERVIPRSDLNSTQLQEGDQLLIIKPTFGG
ncbi:MAG: sulfur carrier protein ThiS [Porphyromonadaceae bacterium]|nr:sulfur carrier protein ThiS [Porphyromonadaceae bacterium]